MSHENAQKALDEGIAPDLVCATCPWDRLCVEPPTMSKQQIAAQIEAAKQEDQAKDPKAMPMGMLITAIAVGGRDQTGKLCPVFALRLRGPDGRRLADGIRKSMRGWSDES